MVITTNDDGMKRQLKIEIFLYFFSRSRYFGVNEYIGIG